MLPRNALSACCRRTAATRIWTRSRLLATEAAATGVAKSAPSPSSPSPSRPKQQEADTVINAGIVLNRSPLITREPTPFEQAYYGYQARIQRALFNPFPDEFYFKAGTILEEKFKKEEEQREREAFSSPRNAPTSKQEDGSTESTSASASSESPLDKEEQPMSRISEADKKGDVKSLDRRMDRNLYLLVQSKDQAGKSQWRFPQGGLEQGEPLHEAARRDLLAECGENMDAWIVSRNPIGVHELPAPAEAAPKTYIFFYKAHILAGQVRPNGKTALDFAWLTKEEIESRVDKEYWLAVKDMLSDF